ncbi:hypothetical protein AWC25_16070 [Mycobacterium sherrisii]|nr:hypothetical protein AWC25_16070 [Mycobacterium sherrisii]
MLLTASRQAFVRGVQAVSDRYRTGSDLTERDGNPREGQILRNCGQDPDHADQGFQDGFRRVVWAAWRFGGRKRRPDQLPLGSAAELSGGSAAAMRADQA